MNTLIPNCWKGIETIFINIVLINIVIYIQKTLTLIFYAVHTRNKRQIQCLILKKNNIWYATDNLYEYWKLLKVDSSLHFWAASESPIHRTSDVSFSSRRPYSLNHIKYACKVYETRLSIVTLNCLDLRQAHGRW